MSDSPRGAPAARGIRSFVAVGLPEAVRARLAESAAALRRRAAGLGWVQPENLHVTLRFLGEVDGPALEAARAAVAAAAAATAPFALTVAGLGAFPSPRAPRVIWAGVTAGAPELGALRARLEVELVARGLPRESRPFHGHVTLARARDARGARRLVSELGGDAMFGEVAVEWLLLLRSELDPRGARYSEIARARLGGAGDSPDVDMTGAGE